MSNFHAYWQARHSLSYITQIFTLIKNLLLSFREYLQFEFPNAITILKLILNPGVRSFLLTATAHTDHVFNNSVL